MYYFLELNEVLDVFGDRNDLTLRPPRKLGSRGVGGKAGFAKIPIAALSQIPGMDLTQ